MASGVITLLSDFGLQDPFVGMVKGVILGVNPQARLVDLTHEIPPQGVREAAWQLATAVEWFPAGTVHLVMVGADLRSGPAPPRALVGQGRRQLYVAPDNGVLSFAWLLDPLEEVWEVGPGPWSPSKVCPTFVGRDLHAPLAARLAAGSAPGSFGGRRLARPIQLDPPWVRPGRWGEAGEGLEVPVVHVDRFGNLVTAWAGAELEGRQVEAVACPPAQGWIPFRRAYQEVPPDEPVALWGAAGTLEVSVRDGDASRRLGAGVGAVVRVRLRPGDGASPPR